MTIPVIHIGPAAMQTAMVALIAALWIGTWVAEREFTRRGLRGDDAWSIVALAASTTIIAGRAIYVAENFSAYASDWSQVIAPAPGTLSLGYGALVGILVTLGYVQHRRLPGARVADALAPGMLTAFAIVALGQFISGDGFGTPSDMPWAMVVWGIARHPVQIYDALAAWIGLPIAWRAASRGGGASALAATVWYSAMRLFIDGFRADASAIGDGYRVSQIIALLALVGALGLFAQRGGNNGNEPTIQIDGERAGE